MPLIIASFITIALAVVLYYIDKRTRFGNLNKILKQIIYGILFGLSAVFATEYGSIEVNGAALNARDAAPVVAGLLFGPWAGVISGAIGAFDRFFIAAAIFKVGEYTQIACSLATLFAGCFSALCNVLLFKNHRPFILHAFVFILVTEVIHMGIVPLTHLDELQDATMVMYACFLPLLLVNAITVVISFTITSYMTQRFCGYTLKQIITNRDIFFSQDLFFSFQFWLLFIIVVAFIANTCVISILYDRMALENTQKNFSAELNAMKNLILKDSNRYGYDFKEMAYEYIDDWSDPDTYVFELIDKDGNSISSRGIGDNIEHIFENHEEGVMFSEQIGKTKIYIMFLRFEDYRLSVYSTEKNTMFLPHFTSCVTTFFQIIVFGILMFTVFLLLKKMVGENLGKINKSLAEITSGNLDEKVDVYTHKEFADLSNSINATVATLKNYIEEEANRYNEEFELAKEIQLSALPSVFPPFPNNPEIDLYAKFRAAREVGGDFYDYYFTENRKLCFLIADVSGKGIPAAMFMMRAKLALMMFARKNRNAASTLIDTNNYLCANNTAGMFVTAWIGILDLDSGHLQYSSAGHNPPMLINSNTGEVKELKAPVSLVLAAIEGTKYVNAEYTFKVGEKLQLFTDGVTEANNEKEELFGEDRLADYLSKVYNQEIEVICEGALNEIDKFAGQAEQFDDITLLTFMYSGKRKISFKDGILDTEVSVLAKIDNVKKVMKLSEECLAICSSEEKLDKLVNVSIDEIYSNIVKYGYKSASKYITVKIHADETDENNKVFSLTFIDTANRFNPLDANAPDISLSAEERDIGGLGIFLVRQMMDDVFYEYKNGVNRLTIVKYYN